MTTQTYYTRQMLMQYGRQLVAARRLARYDQLLGRTHQVSADSSAAKRRTLVERIAQEVMENLIFSGSDNPIVQQVHERLTKEMGEKFIFRYPPAEQDFQVFRLNSEGEEVELKESEKRTLMDKLWQVTLFTVDETML